MLQFDNWKLISRTVKLFNNTQVQHVGRSVQKIKHGRRSNLQFKASPCGSEKESKYNSDNNNNNTACKCG